MSNLATTGGQQLETTANTAYDHGDTCSWGERRNPVIDELAIHQLVGEGNGPPRRRRIADLRG